MGSSEASHLERLEQQNDAFRRALKAISTMERGDTWGHPHFPTVRVIRADVLLEVQVISSTVLRQNPSIDSLEQQAPAPLDRQRQGASK